MTQTSTCNRVLGRNWYREEKEQNIPPHQWSVKRSVMVCGSMPANETGAFEFFDEATVDKRSWMNSQVFQAKCSAPVWPNGYWKSSFSRGSWVSLNGKVSHLSIIQLSKHFTCRRKIWRFPSCSWPNISMITRTRRNWRCLQRFASPGIKPSFWWRGWILETRFLIYGKGFATKYGKLKFYLYL